MLTWLLIALGGAVGALLRMHLGAFVHSTVHKALAADEAFPFGTMFVNLLGSLLLGMAAALARLGEITPLAALVFTGGFCGSLTTFSTLAVDVQRALRDRKWTFALMNTGLSFFGGVGAGWTGVTLFVR